VVKKVKGTEYYGMIIADVLLQLNMKGIVRFAQKQRDGLGLPW
jgi:hypothetical protein